MKVAVFVKRAYACWDVATGSKKEQRALMTKTISDAEAHAMVEKATGPDSAAARQELLKWLKEGAKFECEATRRWVSHMVMIHDIG